MDVALGVVLGVVITCTALALWRLAAGARRVLAPEGEAMRAALHHATATLPHLRRGLSENSARRSASHLRALAAADGLAVVDGETVLAADGDVAGLAVGAPPHEWVLRARADRVHVEEGLPGAAVVAPLRVGGDWLGALVAVFRGGRLGPEDLRVVEEAASLVAAQLEVAAAAEHEERLARAELRALRAQISPHFVYNALAAVAGFIHTRPDEARELLTDFAAFTRYAFRGERPYVTLADELHYVETYLRLEQARFGERLAVRVEVAPEVLQAVVPVLSVQPLVENAVRHGVEEGSGTGTIEIVGRDLGTDVELEVRDDGTGGDPEQAQRALRRGGANGRSGIGLANVDGRLRAAFGAHYGLQVTARDGGGTVVRMTVPKFRAGVRA